MFISFSTCFGRLCAHHREKQLYLCDTWYLLFCMEHMHLHTRQSSTQNNKYKVSHRYSCISWWWAHSRPKHVQKRNKHSKKNCAPRWLYLQDCTEMHAQQNVKFVRPNPVACKCYGLQGHKWWWWWWWWRPLKQWKFVSVLRRIVYTRR